MRGFTPIFFIALLASQVYTTPVLEQAAKDYYPEFKEFLRGTMASDYIPNFDNCYNKIEISSRTFSNINYELVWERITPTEAAFSYLETISELSGALKECYDMGDQTAVLAIVYFNSFGSIQNYFQQFLSNALSKIFDWAKIYEDLQAAVDKKNDLEASYVAGKLVRYVLSVTPSTPPSPPTTNRLMMPEPSTFKQKSLEEFKLGVIWGGNSGGDIDISEFEKVWDIIVNIVISTQVIYTESFSQCLKFVEDSARLAMFVKTIGSRTTDTEYTSRDIYRDAAYASIKFVESLHPWAKSCYDGAFEVETQAKTKTEVFTKPYLLGWNLVFYTGDMYDNILNVYACSTRAKIDEKCIVTNIVDFIFTFLFAEDHPLKKNFNTEPPIQP